MPTSQPSAGLDGAVVREAARWLVRLHSGQAGPDDYAALERWRRMDARHEAAWQRAERLSRQFGALPPGLGVPVLTRSTADRQARVNRRAVMKTLLVLGTALPAAWLVYRDAPLLGGADDFRTAVGGNRQVVLADGSQVQLNTATSVAVRYTPDTRLVLLRRGEIYVMTAPDVDGRSRPFLVDTGQASLRALGTRFEVRQLDDETCLRVLEHRVEVTLRADGARRIVEAGESLRFTAGEFRAGRGTPRDSTVRGGQGGDAPAWTRGVLEADNMRLDAFLAELSRYRSGVVRCDPDVAGLRVSGVFRLADTDNVLAVVGQTLPVRIVRRTPYWVTVTGRPG
ncbi:FecR domain-containing protein [Bordetella genomosp. 9]|uniref:FecR domain-containing protein n=1 Tax=Bordetella genomosp. 9 TaxID=1416803 RepID=UPI000B9E0AAB|nr:FecR domain-containing protein [Bordetella genomosp. 9]